jgi:hypothetical protein
MALAVAGEIVRLLPLPRWFVRAASLYHCGVWLAEAVAVIVISSP